MAAKAAAAGGGGGRSSLFDRLSANAAAESEGARTRRLLATGTAAEPKKAATKQAETQLPSIPGVAKPKKQPPAIVAAHCDAHAIGVLGSMITDKTPTFHGACACSIQRARTNSVCLSVICTQTCHITWRHPRSLTVALSYGALRACPAVTFNKYSAIRTFCCGPWSSAQRPGLQ